VADELGPVYRSTGGSRAAAWVVFLVSVGAAFLINGRGGGPTVGSGVVAAVCLLVAFLALSSLRFQVRAQPDKLIVCSGGRVRKIPWSEVKGFGVDPKRGRVLFVVLPGERRIMLPVPEVRAGRVPATEVRDELQRYWKRHRR
jgi:Bacterial PH domain